MEKFASTFGKSISEHWCFFLFGFTLRNAEKPLQRMELQNKEEEK